MKIKHAGLIGLMVITSYWFQGCTSSCDGVSSEAVGGEFFTVEYKTPAGENYLNSIYNLSGVVVFLDTTGGEDPVPQYELINPGYADGKFGPFYFTERYVNAASEEINNILLFGQTFRFDYYIKKDTYGQDTLSVEFLLGVDECSHSWQSISYFRNGDPLPEYHNQRNAAIVIVE
ncbi:MAG: hypothetical protein R3C61_18220 [Bacteroidia bacterium]